MANGVDYLAESTDGSAKRRCGDCTLCCTVMGVKDAPEPGDDKPPFERCSHACSRGCRIYARRPEACRAFACLWAQGCVPKHMRPDKVGVVLIVDDSGPHRQRIQALLDPARPTLWRETMAPFFKNLGLRGATVAVASSADVGVATHIFDRGGEHANPAYQEQGT